MAGDTMSLEERLAAIEHALVSLAGQIAVLQASAERSTVAIVQAMTALTITLTEVIEAEPERHASPASEDRAAELYKLSIAQRRAQLDAAPPADPHGPRPFSSIARG